MAAKWEANREYLEYLVQLLTAASTATDTAQQRHITKAMEDFNTLPEADRYLLILLTSSELVTNATVRSMAGLILKNNLRQREILPAESILFMQSCGIISALGDDAHLVRSTIGTLLAAVAVRLGRELTSVWPDLLTTLTITSREANLKGLAAAEALSRICEDAGDELMQDPSQPVMALIPELIQLATTGGDQVALAALKGINCFILQDGAIDAHLATLLQTLSQRAAAGGSSALRCSICQALNLLMEGFPEEMQPIIPAILQYMFTNLQQRDDEAVALEACEFWLALAERDCWNKILIPVLPRLLSILMENMVYTDDDPDLEANEESLTIPDRPETIKPRHHQATLHKTREGGAKSEDSESGEVTQSNDEEDESPEDISSWTLRKCSAATLDVLSSSISEQDIVPIILSLINTNISHSEWKRREAGILALGAIADGCMDAIVPHLPQIIPFLVQNLTHRVPLVRAITAWTLSRYSNWIEAVGERQPDLCKATLLGLLHGMADPNKKVQHAACTALSIFCERAPNTVAQKIVAVTQAIEWGLSHYQANNLAILYDTIGALVDSLEPEDISANETALKSIIPPLMNKWTATNEDDTSLFGLLECMCSFAIAAGVHLTPHAPSILQRAFNMVETTLKAATLAPTDVDFDFCIVALDLVGGLVQGVAPEIITMVLSSNNYNLSTLLVRCMDEERPEVRQSVFALIGDFSQKCPAPISQPKFISMTFRAISNNIDVMNENASQGSANNAVWALGELIVRFPDALATLVTPIVPRLCRFLGDYADNSTSRGYLENLAVTIGRSLALVLPPPEFSSILGRWAQLISHTNDPSERETAWTPVVSALISNPTLIRQEALLPLLKGISSFRRAPLPLERKFQELIICIRDHLVGIQNWPSYRQKELAELPVEFNARFSL